jgi:crotonobetainyl-CoA:carnitine CoA-transferase CaiB-like acyl-CoA transferase
VHIVIGANGDSIFRRLAQTMGREDWVNDPGLADNTGRVARVAELDQGIGQWCASQDGAFILRALEDAQVPSGKIYSAADIMRDPQYLARGLIEKITLEDGLELTVPGVVPKLSRTPGRVRGRGPRLGEHNGSGFNPD